MSAVAKRILDVLVAAGALCVGLPLLLSCALAVRLSSRGPVFFSQERLGVYGRPFLLYKFRTMYDGAPDIRHPDGSSFSGSDDRRVTQAGRFLRQTSLDEIPQLFNVLRGDMSLVGPRPDQLDQIRFYTEREKRKLLVKPGITGLAQISGRNNITWEQRKGLDVEYVDRQSFWFDLAILAKTIPYVLLRKDINTDGRHSTSRATLSH
ncbi:MAG: sugar transferase [Bryobacteraceae bacterium]|nr:sugar transferase [Bryobacteraceae bacterium]